MKIAEISLAYLPNIGGIEYFVYRLSRDLNLIGEDIEVLTTDMGISDKSGITTRSNFKVTYFHSILSVMKNPLPPGLKKHLVDNDFDIIHAHCIEALPTLLAAIFKKKSKLIVSPHGVAPINPNLLTKLIWTCYYPIESYIYKRSNNIIVQGIKEKDILVKNFKINPSKINIIPNGIDVMPFPSVDDVIDFKNKYGVSSKKIILYTGRIFPTKNPDVLLRSFAFVNQELKDTQLLLVGPVDITYKNKLLTIAHNLNIANNIIFTGEVDVSELYTAYNIADVFISLGMWEGLPTTMLEAMYFGCPCIMYDSGGINEVIKTGENGFLLDNLKLENIKNNILYIFNNPDKRDYMGKNAKDTVLKGYMWKLCFEKIYSIYKTIN